MPDPRAYDPGAMFDPPDTVTPYYPPGTVILRVLLPVPVDALQYTVPLMERLGAVDATVATVDGWLEFRTAPTITARPGEPV